MILRPYQQDSVNAVYDYLRNRDGNPCIVCPTGAGKSVILAQICSDAVSLWSGRVLILAHVKELLEQNAEKVRHYLGDDLVGLYSAGLKQRDMHQPVIVASIQSIYKKACQFEPFDLVIADECHLIPESGDGMYRTFLRDALTINPNLRIIGTTATAFRMSTGMICGPDNLLNEICYEVGVRELIVQGFLCPLKSKAGKQKADTSSLHIRGGEFIASEVEDLMDDDRLVSSACSEILEQTADRNSILIFASGVHHARHIKQILEQRTQQEVGLVTGDTPALERAELIARFKRQPIKADIFGNNKPPLKYMVNVNVLTTGFDAPNIDCVVLLRPTNSPGLYYQMCLDIETEVLTRSGWRRCHDVTIGDDVAAFDLQTEQVVYVPAQDKVHRALRPHESMYGVCSPHLDIRLTNLHNMVTKSKSHSTRFWRLQPAQEAANRQHTYIIPVAGNGANYSVDALLSDAEVAFLGWFLTDGYHNRSNNTIAIAQSTIKYTDEIRSVLHDSGLGFREYPVHREGKLARYKQGLLFVIPHATPRGINSGKRGWSHLANWIDKDIPAIYGTLSVRQFRILLSAMNAANGSHRTGLSYRQKTMNIAVGCRRRMADRIQQLAIERGFRCNIQKYLPSPTDWNPNPQLQWIINIREQRTATIGGVAKYTNELVPFRCQLGLTDYKPNEWVWCLTTEKGTLVTRRNGKVAVVGNCGRGFRLHPSKTDCLVLDFGGNILRHGPVDDLRIKDRSSGRGDAPAKECPDCHSVIHAAYATCPDCGYEFPPPEREKHDSRATTAGILSGQVEDTEYEVLSTQYSYHVKRKAGPDDPPTLRVEYKLGLGHWQSEWICLEHTGYARAKAEDWWRTRSDEPVPATIEQAIALAEAGALAQTLKITVRSISGQKFDRIIQYVIGPKPQLLDGGQEKNDGNLPEYTWAGDEIPF